MEDVIDGEPAQSDDENEACSEKSTSKLTQQKQPKK
jgi:hypothetical protein